MGGAQRRQVPRLRHAPSARAGLLRLLGRRVQPGSGRTRAAQGALGSGAVLREPCRHTRVLLEQRKSHHEGREVRFGVHEPTRPQVLRVSVCTRTACSRIRRKHRSVPCQPHRPHQQLRAGVRQLQKGVHIGRRKRPGQRVSLLVRTASGGLGRVVSLVGRGTGHCQPPRRRAHQGASARARHCICGAVPHSGPEQRGQPDRAPQLGVLPARAPRIQHRWVRAAPRQRRCVRPSARVSRGVQHRPRLPPTLWRAPNSRIAVCVLAQRDALLARGRRREHVSRAQIATNSRNRRQPTAPQGVATRARRKLVLLGRGAGRRRL